MPPVSLLVWSMFALIYMKICVAIADTSGMFRKRGVSSGAHDLVLDAGLIKRNRRLRQEASARRALGGTVGKIHRVVPGDLAAPGPALGGGELRATHDRHPRDVIFLVGGERKIAVAVRAEVAAGEEEGLPLGHELLDRVGDVLPPEAEP